MPNYIINVKEKGAKKASKNIGGLSQKLGGLKMSTMGAAAGFFGAGMLLSGMKSAIDLAGKQELAEKKLEVSLGRRSQALLDQASALQQVSTFGDEAIIEAQALIAAFVDDEDQIKAATKATLDLAAAKGMDLSAAADLVSKSLGSSTNALSRYGIEVKGAVGSSERLESLTGNLADVFGGQASAQAETMSGKMEQMKNALGDAAEAFGELLFPLVIPLAEGLKLIGESAVSVIDAFKSLITKEQVELLTSAKIEINEFQESINNMSGAELLLAARGFGEMGVLTDAQLEKLNILNEAIMNNSDIQEAAHGKVTELEIRKKDMQENIAEHINNIQKVEIKGIMDIEKAIEIAEKNRRDEKEKSLRQDMKNAALSGQSASQAMKSVVRAETMEAVSGYLASILKTVPFPLNIGLAAAGGGIVAGLMDKALGQIPEFATGGDFVTSGPQLMMVGDNPSGQERVQITPLGGDPNINGPQGGGVNISISGNVMSQDFVEGELSEQIREAVRRGTDFGIS